MAPSNLAAYGVLQPVFSGRWAAQVSTEPLGGKRRVAAHRIRVLICLVGLAANGCGCGVLSFCMSDADFVPAPPNSKIANELDSLFAASDQKAYLLSKPIPKQFDLYRWAMTYGHPPEIWLSSYIAEQGSKIVPELKSRLSHRPWNDSTASRDYMWIALELARGHYDVQSDAVLMALLASAAPAEDEYWHCDYRNDLLKLKGLPKIECD